MFKIKEIIEKEVEIPAPDYMELTYNITEVDYSMFSGGYISLNGVDYYVESISEERGYLNPFLDSSIVDVTISLRKLRECV